MPKDTREIIKQLKDRINSLPDDIEMSALMNNIQEIYQFFDGEMNQDTLPQPNEHTEALRKILQTILTDRTADYIATSQRLDSLGWFARNEYLCIVFNKISSLKRINLSDEHICAYVEENIPHSCAFFHRNHIVIFVNTTMAKMDFETVSGRLSYFIRDSHFKAGYSRIMTGHFNLRRQYLQALISLDLGEENNPSSFNHKFNDVAFYYILKQSTRNLPGYMLCHEKLLHLKEIDEFQNTEYMHTLKLYLDNHLNAVQTAKELYIHRSTFLYRLDKIKDLLSTDLEDPEEILYLMLSFRFLEMEELEENKKRNTVRKTASDSSAHKP